MSGLPLNIDVQQILLHLLNFVILAAGLYILLYKPVCDFMKKREEYYAKMDQNAKDKLEQAESVKAEYEKRMEAVDQEIADKKAQAAAELDESKSKQLEEAKEEANQVLVRARAAAEQERDKMIADARLSIAELAAEATEKLVASSTSDAFDQFLAEAERGESNDEQ